MTKCTNCGAVLQNAPPPGSVFRCQFCGVETRIPLPAPGPVQSMMVPQQQVHVVSYSAKGYAAYYAVSVFMVMGIVGVSLYLSHRAQEAAQERVQQQVQQHVQQEIQQIAIPSSLQQLQQQAANQKTRIPLSSLATSQGLGWQALDAPGMVGTTKAFDCIANFDWAKKIGLAWAPDAYIHRIDADKFAKDGLVDLDTIPEASVTYRILSPSRINDYMHSTSVVDTEVNDELFIKVTKGGVEALKINSKPTREPDGALKPPPCLLSQAMAALEKGKKLPERPVFNMYLIITGANREAYYINTITGTPSIPIVDATSCKF